MNQYGGGDSVYEKKAKLMRGIGILFVSVIIVIFAGMTAECSVNAAVAAVNLKSGTVYASAPNYYDKTKEYMLCLAKYNGDMLVSVSCAKVSPHSDVKSTIPEMYDDAYEYKPIFWDERLIPASSAVTAFSINDSTDGRVVVNESFDDLPGGSIPFVVASRGNIISPQNGEIIFERKNTSDFHIDVRDAYTLSDSVVYDFEFKIIDMPKTSFAVFLKDDNAIYSTVCNVMKGGILAVGKTNINLSENKRYRVSAVYNYSKRIRKYYIDGNEVPGSTEFEKGFCIGTRVGTFRVYCGLTSDAEANHCKFTVDNYRIYEGDVFTESPGKSETVIIITNDTVLGGIDEKISEKDIKSAYNMSDSNNAHPRIHASKKDFDRIREEIKINLYKQRWYKEVMENADRLLKNRRALKYELRDGVRLLAVSRDCLKNMYTLGMAYQLTGESKYADRAWIDLYSVSKFPDWHPKHEIDTAEMCAAAAIGYDWMYDAFSPYQRETVEKGIFQNGFYPYTIAYQTLNGPLGSGVAGTNNHNIVLNGGAVMAALAFMDVYPGICRYIVSNAVTASGIMMNFYGDDGSWHEGPDYWEYTTQYCVKMLSSLSGVFGHCCSLDDFPGLKNTARYELDFQSDCAIFNYGDGGQRSIYVPEMYWLGNKYNDMQVTEEVLFMSDGKTADIEDSVLSLLWYDIKIPKSGVLLTGDSLYPDEGAVFKNIRNSGDMIYVAVHAGYTTRKNGRIIYHSQLDTGTFVYDYGGVRWAVDYGMVPLDLPQTSDYAEYGARWSLFKARAESHNTVVINPDSGPDQNVYSKAYITKFRSSDNIAAAVIDMTDVLKKNADSAKRGLLFTDSRTSLVIRDEIKLKGMSDVYWFMQTTADAEINGNTVILSKDGKKVKLEYICSNPGEIAVEASQPLPSSPIVKNDSIPDAKRIRIHVKSDDKVSITVKLTPFGMGETDVNAYDTDIDDWEI